MIQELPQVPSRGPTIVSLPRLLTQESQLLGRPDGSGRGAFLCVRPGARCPNGPLSAESLWMSLDSGHPTFWTSPLPKILPRDGRMATANSI